MTPTRGSNRETNSDTVAPPGLYYYPPPNLITFPRTKSFEKKRRVCGFLKKIENKRNFDSKKKKNCGKLKKLINLLT
jgi:hypothetical protein